MASDNEVEIRVRVDDRGANFSKIRTAAKKAGGQAGEDFERGFSDRLDLGRSVEARVRVVQSKRGAFGKAGESLGDGTADGFARSSKKVDKATERVANRTQAKFKALQFAGAFAGLPAAAGVAAAGTVAALGAVPLVFAGIAGAAQRNNALVASSFAGLRDQVVSDAEAMTAPLAGTLVQASERLGESWERLKPLATTAFAGSAGPLLTFTDGVTDLAENAMPGLVTAVQASGAPMRGFQSLLGDVGSGASDLFTNLTAGAERSERAMVTFGGIVRDLLGFTGSLFANLTNNGIPVLDQFRGAMQQVYGTILTVTSAGSPLISFVSGFLSTVSGALGVVNVFASALTGWSAPLATVAGSLFAANRVLGLFGTSLGATGAGLGAFAASVDSAGRKTSPFKSAVSGATGVTGKLRAGLGAVVAGGFNPLGLALGAGVVALSLFGDAQQDAARKAAEHQRRLDNLTSAVREDAGALGEATRAATVKALQDADMAQKAAAVGISMERVTAAALGQRGAVASLNQTVDEQIASTLASKDMNKQFIPTVQAMSDEMVRTGKSADELMSKHEASRWNMLALDEAERSRVVTLVELSAETKKQAAAVAEEQERYFELQGALSGTTAETAKLTSAMNEQSEAAADAAGAHLGYLDALDKVEDLTKAAAEAVEQHGEKSEEADDAQRELAKGVLDVVNARREEVKATLESAPPIERDKQARQAANEELRRQIQQLGFVPPALDRMVSSMTASEAQMAGFTLGVNELGQEVVKLPDGKEIVVKADTSEGKSEILDLKDFGDTMVAEGTMGANIDPATGQVLDWKNTTARTVGNTTTFTNIDPATGQVRNWEATTDATGAVTTTFSTVDPATGEVQRWKRATDGTWARVNVDANTQRANSAIDRAARNRNSTITVTTRFAGRRPAGYGARIPLKDGGLVPQAPGYADGGELQHYPDGGLIRGPGGPREDAITLLTSAGTVRASNTEFIVRADQTRKHLPLLEMINSGQLDQRMDRLPRFANGGRAEAAQQMLRKARSVGPGTPWRNSFYEDFSFRGMSDTAARFNDVIAGEFYSSGRGFTRSAVLDFLRSEANPVPVSTESATTSEISTGSASGSRVVEKHYHLTVQTESSAIDVIEQFRRMEAMEL